MFSSSNCTTDSDCHPWYFCNGTCCTCGKDHNGIMLCDQERYVSAILSCHCITYDDNDTYIGACVYRCANEFRGELFDPVYSKIIKTKSNILKLVVGYVNDVSCGSLNRKGMLCGSCKDNHSTVAYSCDLKCIDCPNGHLHKNWLKYLICCCILISDSFFYFLISPHLLSMVLCFTAKLLLCLQIFVSSF